MAEFLFRPCVIIASERRSDFGACGVVLDETKETFLLLTPKGPRRFRKRGSWFAFKMGKRWLAIAGFSLAFRPEERLQRRGPVRVLEIDPKKFLKAEWVVPFSSVFPP